MVGWQVGKRGNLSKAKSNASLTVIPLGGLGEFGMNMMAFRLGDDILVVDAGMMFPESELLGVDLVIPDITYLKQNRQHVRAIVLTHGHEDHIGALPYILRDLDVPIYGTRFTLALVKKRLEEAGLLETAKLFEVTPGRLVEIGPSRWGVLLPICRFSMSTGATGAEPVFRSVLARPYSE